MVNYFFQEYAECEQTVKRKRLDVVGRQFLVPRADLRCDVEMCARAREPDVRVFGFPNDADPDCIDTAIRNQDRCAGK